MPANNNRPIQIPPAAIAALQAAGVTDIAVMKCIDKKGNTRLLTGDGVRDHPDPQFPIATTEILGITPISEVHYKGSYCMTYIMGGSSISFCWA